MLCGQRPWHDALQSEAMSWCISTFGRGRWTYRSVGCIQWDRGMASSQKQKQQRSSAPRTLGAGVSMEPRGRRGWRYY